MAIARDFAACAFESLPTTPRRFYRECVVMDTCPSRISIGRGHRSFLTPKERRVAICPDAGRKIATLDRDMR
jgi:hypothetical protein